MQVINRLRDECPWDKEQTIKSLRQMTIEEVYEPFFRTKYLVNEGENWAYEVAKRNLNDLSKSDCIFAIANGCPPDEGVMIELGYAMALK